MSYTIHLIEIVEVNSATIISFLLQTCLGLLANFVYPGNKSINHGSSPAVIAHDCPISECSNIVN